MPARAGTSDAARPVGRDHRRAITGVVVGMVVLALIAAAFTYTALNILSGGRAYIHGEGRWSKAQQEAVFFLDRYAERGDPADLARARAALAVPLGDREARLALQGAAYDPARARRGFLRGENHPSDVPTMIWLFEEFEHAPYFRDAIDIWARADVHILRLRELADALAEQWREGTPSGTAIEELRTELTAIDQRLRAFEKEFSATLNRGLRTLQLALAVTGVLVLLALAALGVLIFRWATRRIRASEQRFWTSFVHAPMGLALLSADGRCVEVNEALCQTLDRSRERLLGQPLDSVLQGDADDDFQVVLQRAARGGVRLERRLLRADGAELWGELSLRPVPGAPDEAFIAVIEDISEQKRRTDDLSYRASHDSLTGLFNRAHFEHTLAHAVRECRDGDSVHVLGFIDLDAFKRVNDSCGHAAGDGLLEQVAILMRQQLRASDVMARIGGDEFAFLLRDCPPEKGRAIADKLRRAVAAVAFLWDERRFMVSTSIGLVVLDGTLDDPDRALQAADAACYRAKDGGGDQVRTHTDPDAPALRSGQNG